jgi:transposase
LDSCPFVDARPTGAQRLLVLLRLDRGADPGHPSAQADSQAGADQALDRLNPTLCRLYALEGRPSVPPEQLLLASLLQAFYGIRSERLLLDQLHYNLLFRWFVGLSPDDLIWLLP